MPEHPAIPIYTVRGERVVLDSDLAVIYEVTTKRLNEAVKRNSSRFPADFSFQMTREEYDALRSQIATSSMDSRFEGANLRSQIATSKTPGYGGRRYLPRVFTEHGALMAASILNSERAVAMSVYIIRVFVKMREQLLSHSEILRQLARMDRTLLEHDDALRDIYDQLRPLLDPPASPRREIGFHTIAGDHNKAPRPKARRKSTEH